MTSPFQFNATELDAFVEEFNSAVVETPAPEVAVEPEAAPEPTAQPTPAPVELEAPPQPEPAPAQPLDPKHFAYTAGTIGSFGGPVPAALGYFIGAAMDSVASSLDSKRLEMGAEKGAEDLVKAAGQATLFGAVQGTMGPVIKAGTFFTRTVGSLASAVARRTATGAVTGISAGGAAAAMGADRETAVKVGVGGVLAGFMFGKSIRAVAAKAVDPIIQKLGLKYTYRAVRNTLKKVNQAGKALGTIEAQAVKNLNKTEGKNLLLKGRALQDDVYRKLDLDSKNILDTQRVETKNWLSDAFGGPSGDKRMTFEAVRDIEKLARESSLPDAVKYEVVDHLKNYRINLIKASGLDDRVVSKYIATRQEYGAYQDFLMQPEAVKKLSKLNQTAKAEAAEQMESFMRIHGHRGRFPKYWEQIKKHLAPSNVSRRGGAAFMHWHANKMIEDDDYAAEIMESGIYEELAQAEIERNKNEQRMSDIQDKAELIGVK